MRLHLIYQSHLVEPLREALENEGYVVSGQDLMLEQFKEYSTLKQDTFDVIMADGFAGAHKKQDVITLLREIRLNVSNKRIIIQFPEETIKDDTFIQQIINLGIYDLQFIDEFDITDVKRWIEEPKTISDYTYLLIKEKDQGKISQPIEEHKKQFVGNNEKPSKAGNKILTAGYKLFGDILKRVKHEKESKDAATQTIGHLEGKEGNQELSIDAHETIVPTGSEEEPALDSPEMQEVANNELLSIQQVNEFSSQPSEMEQKSESEQGQLVTISTPEALQKSDHLETENESSAGNNGSIQTKSAAYNHKPMSPIPDQTPEMKLNSEKQDHKKPGFLMRKLSHFLEIDGSDKDPYRDEEPKSNAKFKETIIGNVKIGIAGVDSRTGTTHASIQSALFFSRLGYPTACVELKREKMSAFSTFATDQAAAMSRGFSYRKVDFYPQVTKDELLDIIASRYKYIIIDFGSINDKEIKDDFLRTDQQVLTMGAALWDFRSFIAAWKEFDQWNFRKKWYVLVNFGNQSLFTEMTEELDDKVQERLNFAMHLNSFHPDPLKLNTQNEVLEKIYTEMIPKQNRRRA